MRYFLLLPAIVLDALQLLLMLGFTALQFGTPIFGAAGGSLAAGAYCWSASSGIISGVFDAAKCALLSGFVGVGVSTFAIPLGMAANVALSVTIGGGLVLLMAFNGIFYPSIMVRYFIGEAVPFYNTLPLWSMMVWTSIKQKQQDEEAPARGGLGGLATGAIGMAVGAIPGGSIVKGAATAALARTSSAPESPSGSPANTRTPLVATRFTDITPRKAANDNAAPSPKASNDTIPATYAKAA